MFSFFADEFNSKQLSLIELLHKAGFKENSVEINHKKDSGSNNRMMVEIRPVSNTAENIFKFEKLIQIFKDKGIGIYFRKSV